MGRVLDLDDLNALRRGKSSKMRVKVYRSHAEKFAEDLWRSMRRSEAFDVLCDPELNLSFENDEAVFKQLVVEAMAEAFDLVEV